MKLARLSETVHVNPREVASVTLPERGDFVVVTMRSGEVHRIEPGYGKGRWERYDRVLKAIEAAE
jgi:hypothetical protein